MSAHIRASATACYPRQSPVRQHAAHNELLISLQALLYLEKKELEIKSSIKLGADISLLLAGPARALAGPARAFLKQFYTSRKRS